MSDEQGATVIKFPEGRHQRRLAEQLRLRGSASAGYAQAWALWEIAHSLAAIADHMEREDQE